MKAIFAFLALSSLLSCGKVEPDAAPDAVDVEETPTRWVGTLPCADCEGIIYDLSLDPAGKRFVLVTTYQSTPDGDKTYERTGRYTWTETVLCVTPVLPEPEECFWMMDTFTLRKLDMAGNVIESELNYDLKRVE